MPDRGATPGAEVGSRDAVASLDTRPGPPMDAAGTTGDARGSVLDAGPPDAMASRQARSSRARPRRSRVAVRPRSGTRSP